MDGAGHQGEGAAGSAPGVGYQRLTDAGYAELAGPPPAGSGAVMPGTAAPAGGSAQPAGTGALAALADAGEQPAPAATAERAGTGGTGISGAAGGEGPADTSAADTGVTTGGGGVGGSRGADAAPGTAPGRPGLGGLLAGHPVRQHLVAAACFIAAGIAVSWPRVTYLAGKLPATRDAGAYVWGFWWVAHQVEHLGNPWRTTAIAAPVGAQLGLHALMPLPDLIMMPVTMIFGPSASYNLLSALMPGLLCYAMYRAARLWLPSQSGAIAAGAFFGLSSMLVWRSWYHLNLALGALFLPIALEAAVRLTRRPGWRSAVILGVVLAAAILTDQEIAVLVIILVVLTLVAWLARPPYSAAKLAPVGLAALATLVLASPQLIAIYQQLKAGGLGSPPGSLMVSYRNYSSSLPSIFAPSPRLYHEGLGRLPFIFHGPVTDGVPDFGLVLTVAAVAGLVLSWRRGSAWLLALLWLACAALSLGPVLRVGSHLLIPAAQLDGNWRTSAVMPFTWFAKIPGLSGFREPDRMMMLGLVPAALLAGATVNWLRYHLRPAAAVPAIAVLAGLGVLEAGWSGNSTTGTVPTALPAVDGPIAADHSRSIVLDIPYGIRGGTYIYGGAFDPDAQVLATADGHPRAIGYISRLPLPTLNGISRHAFYSQLVARQRREHTGPQELAAARRDLAHLDIGWVIVWNWGSPNDHVTKYLRLTGFHVAYRADGVTVWRHWPARHARTR